MTKPVTRKMAIQALLQRFITGPVVVLPSVTLGHDVYHLVCPICGALILPEHDIQFDHIHAHSMGGPHEYQNLRPIHYDPCHKQKSKRDVAALAKVDRITGKTKKKRKRKWPKRKMGKR